tara:strand:- start:2821 stop:3837 length:1017 start_codon:yes stop_codon:yes gene_type:complete
MAPLRSLSNPISSFNDRFAKTSTRASEAFIPPSLIIGNRALFGGGWIPSSPDRTNDIQYINIASTGNASQFGNLSSERTRVTSCQASGRGVFMGGNQPGGPYVDTIEYITVSSLGDVTDFGNLTETKNTATAVSSATRGVCGGGYDNDPNYTNVIEYITMASTGNGTDFGDLTDSRSGAGGASDGTRGVFMGGWPAPNVSGATDTMDYITIASTGNATNFGDLLTGNHAGGSCSPGIYGYFLGGDSTPYTATPSNVIQRITIETTGNSTDVGDLTFLRNGSAGAANKDRGVCAGGNSVHPYNVSGYLNQIEYFVSTGGNSQDFGDLDTRAFVPSGMSG